MSAGTPPATQYATERSIEPEQSPSEVLRRLSRRAPTAAPARPSRAARAAEQAVDEVVSAQSRLDDKLGRKIDDGVRRIERKLDQPMRLDVNKREFGRLVREVS